MGKEQTVPPRGGGTGKAPLSRAQSGPEREQVEANPGGMGTVYIVVPPQDGDRGTGIDARWAMT